jgi:hypothetical protein
LGLLDLPAPLFSMLDTALATFAPPLVRIVLWAVAGAAASMLLYRAISPQARIAEGKRRLAEARRELDAYEGELGDAGPLITRMLGIALRQVGRTTLPAVIASLPVLALLVWLSTAYGHRYPEPEATPAVTVEPDRFQARWLGRPAPEQPPRVGITDGDGETVTEIALTEPVPVIHQHRFWNYLIGNPAGYLPEQSVVQAVHVALPSRDYLPFGPDWLRGWVVPFFVVLVTASIAIKVIARIE